MGMLLHRNLVKKGETTNSPKPETKVEEKREVKTNDTGRKGRNSTRVSKQ